MDNKQILSEIIVQVLGFLVVFGLLRYFAWNKLLGMIDARRKKIADEFQRIEDQKKALADLEKDYRQRIENIEHEARAKIEAAAISGEALAKEIQEKARLDAEKLIERAQRELAQDIQKARVMMRDQIVEISGLMTEKILKEKMDSKDHEKLVDQFIKEIEKI